MSPRLARISRLLDLANIEVQAAESALAGAAREALAAQNAATEAESAWAQACARNTNAGTAADLELASNHVRSMRARADLAARKLAAARDQEERQRAAVREARVRMRKLETWRDRLTHEANVEAERLDRIASDELAARTRGAR